MVAIDVEGLTVRHPDGTVALDDLDLHVADGESMVIAGPTGSGKTTLLRAIAGLQKPSSGDVRFDGTSVLGMTVAERDVALVSSESALYRHLDVRANLAFPLDVRGVAREQRDELISVTSRVLHIARLLGRRPSTLSGGERQRVALGRSTGRTPRAFLLDEPLAQLEPAERERLANDLRGVQRGMGVTMLYVTHEQRELMTLGSRLVVLNRGRVEQVGAPLDLYRRPATTEVATYVGDPPMAMVRGHLDVPRARLGIAGREYPLSGRVRAALLGPRAPEHLPRTVLVGLRPEHVRTARSRDRSLPLVVGSVTPVGSGTLVSGDLSGRPASRVTMRLPPAATVAVGDVVDVALDVDSAHLFDAASGRALHPTPLHIF